MELIGHLVRMDHGRVVTKILESKLEERGGMGRPSLRCLGDECLKMVTAGRGERASTIKEAKTWRAVKPKRK
jgi:hypothetical protein